MLGASVSPSPVSLPSSPVAPVLSARSSMMAYSMSGFASAEATVSADSLKPTETMNVQP
ncbi:MAG: hypothetical protein K0S49_2893, partial [Microbacterium sp.]|nr:hypothetical protein [Microbacterium sp.]